MIDKVEIYIVNGLTDNKEYIINNKTKKVYINGIIKDIKEDFVERLVDIIKFWKNDYGTETGLDVNEYTINLYENNIKETYHGKGNYPTNFELFIELLGELNE